MNRRAEKKDISNYLNQWESIHAMDLKELRRMSVSKKFSQLMHLMSSFKSFSTSLKNLEEELAVRKRWNRLRKLLRYA